MSITLELSPDTEARLRRRAAQHGQDMNTYVLNLVEREVQAQPDTADAPEEGTAADLFAGRLGRIHSGGEGRWSENCGEKFAEGMEEKRRQGRL